MRWVVAYDIQDDKRRRRVEKVLRGFGFRVQYSVFECGIQRRQLERLRKLLQDIIAEGDRVRFYLLCDACERRLIAIPPEDPLQQGPAVVW